MHLCKIGFRYSVILLGLGVAISCDSGQSPVAHRACVSAATPEAAQAGYEILAAGGNAADAAVAVAFALGVTEPAMSGIGGGMQVLYAPAGEQPVSINGTTWSPGATPTVVDDTLTYHRRSTVPGTVRTLGLIHQQYGSGMAWDHLLAPAIRLAEQGFVVGPFRHRVYKRTERTLNGSPFIYGQLLLQDGTIPAAGDTLRQLRLASTLRRLSEAGPQDFYTGEIASKIVRDMQEHDGWISTADLADFPEPEVRAALHTTHLGRDVYTTPPPSGGWTALLILNLLEASKDMTEEPRELWLARSINLAHGVRRGTPQIRHDPDLLAEVLSVGYAKVLVDSLRGTTSDATPESDGETTHFSVVDGDGNAISVTASINAYFGAAALCEELGFLYNSYMDDFVFNDTGHVDAIRPHAAAYSSMSPTIVQRDGQTRLILGSPGSARIISTVAQLTHHWIVNQTPLEDLLLLPRVHAQSDRVYLELTDLPASVFRAEGFTTAYPTYDLVQQGRNAYFGGVHAIVRSSGGWMGGADPRRDGAVVYLD